MGKILSVDLDSRETSVEGLNVGWARDLIGGGGYAARILYEKLGRDVDPFSPANVLVIMTGPAIGTLAPGGVKWTVASRSPLTMGWGEAMASGMFGMELKRSGFDGIVISGRADRPVYLWIKDCEAELKEAGHLWGGEIPEVCEAIKRELRDEKVKVACIGPSGEKLVRIAGIVDDDGRAAGRTGMGAVMGSKNLKAVAVRGTKIIPVADKKRVEELSAKIREEIKEAPGFKALNTYGTPAGVEAFEKLGNLPIKNWTKGVFPEVVGIGAPKMHEAIVVGRGTCPGCPVACWRYSEVKEEPFKTIRTRGPEYETIAGFGSLCMVNDIRAVQKANEVCQRYGIDPISTSSAVAFAMECFEKGILGKEEIGFDLRWGDGEAMIRLAEMIAKREGVGNMLAEGVKRAADKIGRGAERFAIHVKGLEVPYHHPRRFKSMGLEYATANRGACHLQGNPMLIERGVYLIPELGYSQQMDGFVTEGKGKLTKVFQDLCSVLDAMGLCKFTYEFGRVSVAIITELYSAITGIEEDVEGIMRKGERIWNMKRAFNIKMGFTAKDDTLPERFLKDPLREGPVKDVVVELDRMLPEYYEGRGWDPETGKPTKEKLIELGLEDIARDLWG